MIGGLKNKLTAFRYPIPAEIFRVHDNNMVSKRDRARLRQAEGGIFWYEFQQHSPWKKVDDEYIFMSEGLPNLKLLQIAHGIYVPMKVICDFGEYSPNTVKQHLKDLKDARDYIEPIDRQIANIKFPRVANPKQPTKEEQKAIEEYKAEVKKLNGTEDYLKFDKQGKDAFEKLKQIKGYFYIPKEEAKHWFGRKMEETWQKYPSRGDLLKKYLPIGILIIGFVLFLAFWPKIREMLGGII